MSGTIVVVVVDGRVSSELTISTPGRRLFTAPPHLTGTYRHVVTADDHNYGQRPIPVYGNNVDGLSGCVGRRRRQNPADGTPEIVRRPFRRRSYPEDETPAIL